MPSLKNIRQSIRNHDFSPELNTFARESRPSIDFSSSWYPTLAASLRGISTISTFLAIDNWFFLKISRILRLILFRITALPTFLETESPNFGPITPNFGWKNLKISVKNDEFSRLPDLNTRLNSSLSRRRFDFSNLAPPRAVTDA